MNKIFQIENNEYNLEAKVDFNESRALYQVSSQNKTYYLEQYIEESKLNQQIEGYQLLLKYKVPVLQIEELDLNNYYLVKEYQEGELLYYLILNDEMKEEYLNQVKEMARKLEKEHLALDYFPLNFMVVNDQVIYIKYDVEVLSEENSLEAKLKFFSKTQDFDDYVKHHSR